MICRSLVLTSLVTIHWIVGDGLEEDGRNAVNIVLRDESDAAETACDDAEDSVDSCVELSVVLLNLLIKLGDPFVEGSVVLLNLSVKFVDLILKVFVLSVKSLEFSLESTLLGIGSDHVLELLGEVCTELLGVELVCLKSGVHLLKRGDLTLKSANLSILAESLLQRIDVAEGESCVTLSLVSGGLGIVSGLLGILNGGLKTRNIPLKGSNLALEGGDVLLGDLKVSLQGTYGLVNLSDGIGGLLRSLLEVLLGGEGRNQSLNSGSLILESLHVSLKSLDGGVDVLDIVAVSLRQGVDLALDLCLQRSVSVGIGLLQVCDVLVVLRLKLLKGCLEGLDGRVGLRLSVLQLRGRSLQILHLALHRSQTALNVINAVVNLVDILRVVRTAGVRECYASNGEHRNQSKKFVHKG